MRSSSDKGNMVSAGIGSATGCGWRRARGIRTPCYLGQIAGITSVRAAWFGPAKRTHAALARSTEWRAWRRALGERVPRAGALGYASNLAAPLFALLGNLRDLSEDRIGRPKWRTRADSLMRAAISLIADLNSLQGRKKFPVQMRRELAHNALIYCPFLLPFTRRGASNR